MLRGLEESKTGRAMSVNHTEEPTSAAADRGQPRAVRRAQTCAIRLGTDSTNWHFRAVHDIHCRMHERAVGTFKNAFEAR